MGLQNISKINKVLQEWKTGTVFVNSWFESYGVSRQLLKKYLDSNWIKRIGNGAYIRSGDKVDWIGGLYAIQKQLNLPVHIGGRHSLQIHGLSHYLFLAQKENVELYAQPETKLPEWFKNYEWNINLSFFTTNLFSKNIGLTERNFNNYQIIISSPERAIMEFLSHVPELRTFDEADKIMEGLLTFRSELVTELLEDCNSVKVKRLFLYLAENNNLPWLKDINIKNIDLGKGNRSIVKNGSLDKKYKITVPKKS